MSNRQRKAKAGGCGSGGFPEPRPHSVAWKTGGLPIQGDPISNKQTNQQKTANPDGTDV